MKQFRSLPDLAIKEVCWSDLHLDAKFAFSSHLEDHVEFFKENKGMFNFHVLTKGSEEVHYKDTIVQVECQALVEIMVNEVVVVVPFVEGEVIFRPISKEHEISKVTLYSNHLGTFGQTMDQFVQWRENWPEDLGTPNVELLSYWSPERGMNAF